MNDEGKFEEVTPAALSEMRRYIETRRTANTPFDFVIEGSTREMDAAQIKDRLATWQAAGATWWMETLFGLADEQVTEIIRKGPAFVG
jgi:hypothetical protein